MHGIRSLTALVATALILGPGSTVFGSDDTSTPAVDTASAAGPRLLLPPGGAALGLVLDVATPGDDLVYLGQRRREREGLHWIDTETGQDERLTRVLTGDFMLALEELGDSVVFTGGRWRTGVEPWRSDGTRRGTQLIKDVGAGRQPRLCAAATAAACGTYPASSAPRGFTTLGDIAYFPAYQKKRGLELWRTDGTGSGTRLLRDIGPAGKSGIHDRGTVTAVADDSLYFIADDGRHGWELWKSDGTRDGTRMISDIGPGWSVQWWDAPVAVGEEVYFVAQTADTGFELWKTDGTVAGTMPVMDIRPGAKASKPEDLTAVGDVLYFTANDGEHGRELWRSDGTPEGTMLVRDLSPGRGSSDLGEFAALGDRLYFAVWSGPGSDVVPGALYRSDGTEDGTRPFGPAHDDSAGLRRVWNEFPVTIAAGDRLFFSADDGVHGLELWSTDGTEEGTMLVGDLNPGPGSSRPHWLSASDEHLYFIANDGDHGRQFWQLPLATG